jgi:hypothetical protein
MAIFRGVGGSGDSSDNSFLQEVTAQATTATTKANEASASASTASTKAGEALASANSAASSVASLQNNSISSAAFNTGDGVLTLTKLGGATVTADLDGRFLTSYTETNDLSSAVTWVNVPNAYITTGSVTQHQAALTITESQISDLQSYLTSYTETNNLTTAVTWADVPDANITESSVTQYLTAANVTSPLTGGTGISVASNGTITNDSPDQTVALTGTGATTVTGTYPNFTIDSTNTTYTIGDGGLTTNDFTDVDHTKLNGIEANATADQTGAEIKSAYEAVSDTNAFTDAEKTKLSGIEASADVTDTVNVTAAGALMDSEVTNLAQVKAFDSSDYLTTHQDISGKANLSGATFTGNVNVKDGLLSANSGTQQPFFKVSTVAASGSAGVFVDGDIVVNGTVDGVDIAGLNTTVAGKANLSGATFSGNVNIGTPPSGNQNLLVSGLSTLFGGASVTGDITVTGTVDGRDVATDGTKLDTLEREYRTRFRERNSLTSVFQYLTSTIADIGTPVYTKSTTGSENTLDFYLGTTCADYYDNNDGHIEVVVTAPQPTNEDTVYLGTASNPVNNASTGRYFFDVDGDVTHHLTDYCGMSVNSDGSNAFLYGETRSNAYYNPNTNKTTISCNLYQSYKPALYQTVYLHPFDWENSGTDIIGSTIQIDEVVYNSQKMSRRDFSVYLGYFKSKVSIQLRGKETSSTTDNIAIRNFGGVITQIED